MSGFFGRPQWVVTGSGVVDPNDIDGAIDAIQTALGQSPRSDTTSGMGDLVSSSSDEHMQHTRRRQHQAVKTTAAVEAAAAAAVQQKPFWLNSVAAIGRPEGTHRAQVV